MLQINNVDAYYGDVQVLSQINFEVNEGEVVTIVGANGAGKSTTINAISGLLAPRRGKIYFQGESIGGMKPHKIVEKGIIQVPEGRRIFPEMTVHENLLMGGYPKRVKNFISDNIKKVFELFPILEERKNQLAGTLSGGERQMLAIGRGLMSMPKLLMLDEPSLGLAPILVQKMFDAIETLKKSGTTILLVEQDVIKALSIADRGYVLQNGGIVQSGSGKELLQNKDLKDAYLGLV